MFKLIISLASRFHSYYNSLPTKTFRHAITERAISRLRINRYEFNTSVISNMSSVAFPKKGIPAEAEYSILFIAFCYSQ